MAIDVSKFVARFVEETRDHIERLNEGLSSLDGGHADSELINTIFRSAHTIKGSSRMLKLSGITDTAHHIEEVLMHLRDGSLTYSPTLGQLLYRGVDALSALVDALAGSDDPISLPAADQSLCAELAAVTGGEDDAVPNTADPVSEAVADSGKKSGKELGVKPAETVRIQLNKLDELVKLMGEVVSSHACLRQRIVDLNAIRRLPADDQLAESLKQFAQIFRDDVTTQEALMTELHATTQVMRMLPLTTVFEPVARLARELARSLNKEIECVVSGAEIELDRQMIDNLSDPIIHLVRNALDHGLEMPEDRLAIGKKAQGQLKVSARQDGSWVVIDISDDGNGIRVEDVRDKALKKNLISADEVATLSDQEIIDFIFMPGFSTSSIITDMSGRGVGMDVVKRCVLDELRGVVSVETRSGIGSTFSLRLPLSLAVMRVLLVETAGLPFAFTGQYVGELLRYPAEELLAGGERQVMILRNEFIPVVPLCDLLQIPAGLESPVSSGAKKGAPLLLLVLKVRNEKLAVQIDKLIDERNMVIKPLPQHMRKLNRVSGMVTTAKNELVSILHAPALFEVARQTRTKISDAEAENHQLEKSFRVLVVDDSLNTREIEKDVLEASGYQVTLAEDGLDGFRKAMSNTFDAVLTDVEMPNMDGFTLTERLRQEEAYSDKPIIIITSLAKDEDRRRGVKAGADAYIVKGDFDRNNLVDTLHSLLG